MELLKDYTDAQVRKLAAEPTPPPMVGEWMLVAPDGRTWMADSPMHCVQAEQRDRVPPLVGLARIKLALIESIEDSIIAASQLRCINCGQTMAKHDHLAQCSSPNAQLTGPAGPTEVSDE